MAALDSTRHSAFLGLSGTRSRYTGSRQFGLASRGCDVALKDLQSLMWNGALLSGGLSIVARVHARQAWKRFKAALVDPHLSGNRLYQRDWDFRYWDRIGVRAAEFSILCSILWLLSRLLYL
jgi:hypothetical protein